MLLLHISDIHFRHPECTTGMDPELPYRTMLVQDARRLSAELGPIDAILVTGDIAYHALPLEYKAAYEWLGQDSLTHAAALWRGSLSFPAITISTGIRSKTAPLFAIP